MNGEEIVEIGGSLVGGSCSAHHCQRTVGDTPEGGEGEKER